jgi:hypothetical protein
MKELFPKATIIMRRDLGHTSLQTAAVPGSYWMTFRFFWMKYRSKNEKPFSPSSLIAQIFNDQRSEKKPGDKFSGFSGITDVNRFRTKVTVRPQDEQHCVPNKKRLFLFLMSIFSKFLLSLMCGDLFSFTLTSAGHDILLWSLALQ